MAKSKKKSKPAQSASSPVPAKRKVYPRTQPKKEGSDD